jgi:hypothetical protein
MRSILTVTSPASSYDLTTLATAKEDLGISDSSQDAKLSRLITAASRAVATYLNRVMAKETVVETIRFDDVQEYVVLQRAPVVTITSAVEDGTTVDADEYETDQDSGTLYRLDASGYRHVWIACKSLVVTYEGGWVLPGNSGRTLPEDIEQGTLAMLRGVWSASGRDPMLKAERVDGVGELEYWVGSSSQSGFELPSDVQTLLAPYRRIYA